MIEERIRLTMRHLQNSLHCARMFQKEEIKELLIARFSIFLWKPACSSCRWRSISDFPRRFRITVQNALPDTDSGGVPGSCRGILFYIIPMCTIHNCIVRTENDDINKVHAAGNHAKQASMRLVIASVLL